MLSMLWAIPGFTQNEDHVPGEILVQLRAEVRASAWANQQASLRAAGSGFVLDEAPLSEPLQIWKLRFDPQTQNENELLARLRQDPAVLAAQFNHYVELRSAKTPNDPDFVRQWYLSNTGQDGGTPGLDLGMPQAWDITTGGLSPNGDTIVVCVIDDGIDVNHRDLQANLWRNNAEIPDNNRDDDENGYIDDYEGWNVRRRNDDINEDATHGTEVAGFIGAVGNNNLGISGINWKVKIMGVVGGYNSSTEDIIIQAYNYPYLQRRLYNQTGGKKGAFVVATNASWGFARSMPDQYPIWCNFFDSLGQQGIINAVATSNTSVDVDVAGDMPGSCGSPYIITVTSINRTGALSRGFGKASVDLAALGDQALTTAKNNGYTVLSGTSFSAPQVAGAVGLLYAAPCPTLASLARRDPKAAALWIRRLILENTKPLPSLANTTSSGGYLHVYSSLLALGKQCGSCPSLVSIAVNNITINSAQLSWTSNDSIRRVDLRFRSKGSTNWTTVERVLPPYNFSNLQTCTEYEFQFKTYCRNSTIEFEETFSFRTDGCCEPPSKVELPDEIFTNVIIRWQAITAASSYTFRYRALGSTSWITLTPPFTSVNLRNLSACTNYEFQLRSECVGGTSSAFSKSFTFKTRNCGACLDRNYCKEPVLIDQAEQEWIKSVQVGSFSNNSARNGYGDFTGMKGLDLRSGQSYNFRINIGYKGQLFNEYVLAWIDFNQDGVFGSRELVYNSGAKKDTVFTGTINVPTGIPAGPTRMRVILRYNTEPSTCLSVNNFFGEVEDYCVNVDQISTSTRSIQSLTQLQIFPNPFVDEFVVKFRLPNAAPNAQLEVWNAQGQLLYTRAVAVPGNLVRQESIAAGSWPKGLYLVRLRAGVNEEEVWAKVLKAE
jgi:subtilisin family serine protease